MKKEIMEDFSSKEEGREIVDERFPETFGR
jgi:hypothetical protein